jgi:hypothetical protein
MTLKAHWADRDGSSARRRCAMLAGVDHSRNLQWEVREGAGAVGRQLRANRDRVSPAVQTTPRDFAPNDVNNV